MASCSPDTIAIIFSATRSANDRAPVVELAAGQPTRSLAASPKSDASSAVVPRTFRNVYRMPPRGSCALGAGKVGKR